MFCIQKKIGFKYRDRIIIYSQHENQMGIIQGDHDNKEANNKKGVRQGCISSPLLFHLHVEETIQQLKDKYATGINYMEKEFQC